LQSPNLTVFSLVHSSSATLPDLAAREIFDAAEIQDEANAENEGEPESPHRFDISS
jgi:hypothetical protein